MTTLTPLTKDTLNTLINNLIQVSDKAISDKTIEEQINLLFLVLFPDTNPSIQTSLIELCNFFMEEADDKDNKLNADDFIVISQKIKNPIFSTCFFTTLIIKSIKIYNTISDKTKNWKFTKSSASEFAIRSIMYVIFIAIINGSPSCTNFISQNFISQNKDNIKNTVDEIFNIYHKTMIATTEFSNLYKLIKANSSCSCFGKYTSDEDITLKVNQNQEIITNMIRNI